MHLAGDHVHPTPRRGRCRIRIFVPDEEGELLGDRAVVVCSEVEGNGGASVTEASEALHESVSRYFGLVSPVWIEHHDTSVTDGATELWELVIFPFSGRPIWKPLDRRSVETLVGRRLGASGAPGPKGLGEDNLAG